MSATRDSEGVLEPPDPQPEPPTGPAVLVEKHADGSFTLTDLPGPPEDMPRADDAPADEREALDDWLHDDDDGELDEFAELYVDTSEPIELPPFDPQKVGRRSFYRPEYDEAARRLCMLGLGVRQMAAFFGVQRRVFTEWAKVHPSFRDALTAGRTLADARVAEGLFRRATGYSHKAVKILVADKRVTRERYIEHYPPDTEAAKFWLKNRQPALWRDKVDHTIAGGDKPLDVTDSRANEQRDHILALQQKIVAKHGAKKPDGGE